MKARKFKNFEFTDEFERVCFDGWDGKSYNGESEVLPVYNLDSFFRSRLRTHSGRFVPKYTRKWGWTMHEIRYDWPYVGGNPTTDLCYSDVELDKG